MENRGLRPTHGNAKLVGLSLILMISGSLVMILGPRPHYHGPREPIPQTRSFNFNVTSEESEWNYTISQSEWYTNLDRIGITDMNTNGTPVGLAIQNRNNVTVLAFSSVSRITNSSLVVPGSEDLKIVVTRETSDANGSLVILTWELLPPPPIDPIILWIQWPFILSVLISMIVVWKIVTLKTARQSIRPLWVVTLVVVGLVLLFPYITGSLGGFFTPTDVTEQVYSDRRTLVLNGTNPNSLVPFGNEVPNNAESFRIHSFEDDNEKYHFELRGANGEVLLSATHENSSIAWEILGEFVNREHSLSLDRVDSDVDVSLTIEVSATTTRLPVDPLPSTILAILGFTALILAIATGFSVQTQEKVGQN